MKLLKYIYFLVLLSLQQSFVYVSDVAFSNREYVHYNIELSEKPNSDFLKTDFRENYIFKPSFLENVSCPSVSIFEDYAELIQSWKTIKYCGDDELAKLATNVDELTDVSKHVDEINNVGYSAWKASRPTRLVEGKNIFRASSQEYSLAKKTFKEYREGVLYEQKKLLPSDKFELFREQFSKRNLASVEGRVGTQNYSGTIRRSGDEFDGTQIFDSYKVDKRGSINTDGAWSREWDTEYVILSEIAQSQGAVKGGKYLDVSGEIKIISELPYCVSCQGVIQDFSNMFPNVNVILIDGVR
jgi:hypothetical protein